MTQLLQQTGYLDLAQLNQLRVASHKQDDSSLAAVAKQFEGIFVQMLMQSMRQANEAFRADSPFNSNYTRFYEQMFDQQLSAELSQQGMLGLSEVIISQLSPQTQRITPASALSSKQTNNINIVNNNTGEIAAISGNTLPTEVKHDRQFSSPTDFVLQLYPFAKQAAQSLDVEPAVLLAQSALETGWGKKMIRDKDGVLSNNFFNIKADERWHGDRVQVGTLEFKQGLPVPTQANFRVYPNATQSFDDYVDFVKSSERYAHIWPEAKDPQAFISGLHQAGYATDPDYADKVIRVMERVKTILDTN